MYQAHCASVPGVKLGLYNETGTQYVPVPLCVSSRRKVRVIQ